MTTERDIDPVEEGMKVNIRVTKSAVSAICVRHFIGRMSIFGSATQTGSGLMSDVGVMVEFQPDRTPGLMGIVTIREELSGLFKGREVHVATRAVLVNPYRRASILRDLVVLYESPKRR